MKDTESMHFFSSEEIFEKAKTIFQIEKENIEEKILPTKADIQHVGSCSVSGALAKFDVDIQVRVEAVDFDGVVAFLEKAYSKKHLELWNDSLAIFNVDKECQIDIVVTVIDSKYDDYYKVRDYFILHPEFLEQYNSLKRSFEGKSYLEYKTAKRNFFGLNGQVKFL